MSLALGKIACSPAAPEPVTPPPTKEIAPTAIATSTAAPIVTAEPVAPPAEDPSAKLAGYAVTSGNYARRALYTWTSDAQIDELLQSHVLLSRTESPKYGPAYFDVQMEMRWMAGDKLAALLRAQAFRKARFAWTAPWATLMGWPDETYGGQLIEVTLKPEAWIASFRTSTQSWEARDLNGAAVPTDQLLKRPDRIAAVYFVHDFVAPPASGLTTFSPPRRQDGREAYREYVLCNESMIESWSIGTERIAGEIRDSADLLESAAKYFEQHPVAVQREDRWNAHVALLVWPGLVEGPTAKEIYESSLAFPNGNYELDPPHLRAIATALRGLSQRAKSTTWRPNAVFPGAKPVPVPPAPPPQPAPRYKIRGTFG